MCINGHIVLVSDENYYLLILVGFGGQSIDLIVPIFESVLLLRFSVNKFSISSSIHAALKNDLFRTNPITAFLVVLCTTFFVNTRHLRGCLTIPAPDDQQECPVYG